MLYCIRPESVLGQTTVAQPPTVQPEGLAGPQHSPTVRLNFPSEIELKVLADYVSQRLNIRILYDEQLANKKISIKAPEEIPVDSLLELLQSALRIKGMTVVDADVPGWKRIVVNSKLSEIAVTADTAQALDQLAAGTPVTQAFSLRFAESQAVDQAIKPFLTVPGASSIAIKEPRVLIVTDYAANVQRIAQWIELIDQPKAKVAVEMRTMRHVEAASVSQQITTIMNAKSKAEGGTLGGNVEIAPDPRTNQLIIIGNPQQIGEVMGIVEALDVPLGVTTAVHPFQYVSAERIDRLMKGTMDPTVAKSQYKSTVEKEGNQLFVTGTPDMHARIDELRRSMDLPTAARSQSPVQFYEIKNAGAVDLLETLRSMNGNGSESAAGTGDSRTSASPSNSLRTASQTTPAAPNPGGQPSANGAPAAGGANGGGLNGDGGGAGLGGNGLNQPQKSVTCDFGDAKITADPTTNTLIVVAEPSVQQTYSELIHRLDRRRPQVLIEAKIIVLDTSDEFSLGIDLSNRRSHSGLKNLLAFSSFGLSKVDPVSGALSLMPGVGFNGALLDPGSADVVFRALSAHRRARLLSSPKILVNDNATGVLTSVAEVPFTSVNASQTVATTSFAGFAKAGTTIIVTPHISEGDHLQLRFRITMNSFTGDGANGVPPPRQTDEVESHVDVPDGHTVIVGGLNRKNDSSSRSALPFIENVPVVGNLLSNRSKTMQNSSLFVFLRPVVLREDKFKDLKFLSSRDEGQAGLPAAFPLSQPLLMR